MRREKGRVSELRLRKEEEDVRLKQVLERIATQSKKVVELEAGT